MKDDTEDEQISSLSEQKDKDKEEEDN